MLAPACLSPNSDQKIQAQGTVAGQRAEYLLSSLVKVLSSLQFERLIRLQNRVCKSTALLWKRLQVFYTCFSGTWWQLPSLQEESLFFIFFFFPLTASFPDAAWTWRPDLWSFHQPLIGGFDRKIEKLCAAAPVSWGPTVCNKGISRKFSL